MDDAAAMRLAERFRHFFGDAHRLQYRHAAARQQVREILAGDEFHDEERLAAGRFAVVVDAGDVGMTQRGSGAGFAQKAGAVGLILRRRAGEFDGHAPPQVGVFGEVHHTHSPASQLAEDSVMRNGLPYHVSVKLFSDKGMGEDKAEGGGLVSALVVCRIGEDGERDHRYSSDGRPSPRHAFGVIPLV